MSFHEPQNTEEVGIKKIHFRLIHFCQLKNLVHTEQINWNPLGLYNLLMSSGIDVNSSDTFTHFKRVVSNFQQRTSVSVKF